MHRAVRETGLGGRRIFLHGIFRKDESHVCMYVQQYQLHRLTSSRPSAPWLSPLARSRGTIPSRISRLVLLTLCSVGNISTDSGIFSIQRFESSFSGRRPRRRWTHGGARAFPETITSRRAHLAGTQQMHGGIHPCEGL